VEITLTHYLFLAMTVFLTGMVGFILAHVPLFALIVGLVASECSKLRQRSRLAIAAFLVFHAVLHIETLSSFGRKAMSSFNREAKLL